MAQDYKVFTLFGGTAMTTLPDVTNAEQLPGPHKDAAIKARQELAEQRLIAELYLISVGQVAALPNLQYDLLDHIAIVDVARVCFSGRKNRTDGS